MVKMTNCEVKKGNGECIVEYAGPVDLETKEKVDKWYVAPHRHFKKMTKCEKGEKCIVEDTKVRGAKFM